MFKNHLCFFVDSCNKTFCLTIPLICFSFILYGQVDTLLINCTWSGELTQVEGGFTDRYDLEIRFDSSSEEIISGIASVSIQDTLVAHMLFDGQWHNGGYIKLSEYEIENAEEVDDYEWCTKKYSLYLRQKEDSWYLIGFWTGRSESSVCPPGKILLRRKPFRV